MNVRWLFLAVVISVAANSRPVLSGGPSDAPAATPKANPQVEHSATQRGKGAGKQKTTDELPPPLTHYKGRQIADFMTFHGADWLTRDIREEEENCSAMLAALGIKPGDIVCDMGCGNGFYSLQLARLVGKKGKVLAVDIQPEMLSMLKGRAREEKLKNIRPILGTPVDPKLPEGGVDLILLVDVYHEFSYPEEMLLNMRKSLKPTGRLALVEFRLEDPRVPIKLLHKMSKEQILKEIPANGYKLSDQYDKLPWQHLMFFERDDAPAQAPTAPPES